MNDEDERSAVGERVARIGGLSLPTAISRERLGLVLGVAFFLVAFHITYKMWAFPVYGFLGFGYPEKIGLPTCIGYILGIVPSFFIPIWLTRPSQFLFWMIYLITYLPAMLVVSFVGFQSELEVMKLQAMLFLGLTIIGSSQRFRLIELPDISIGSLPFWVLITFGALALFGRTYLVFAGKFQFVAWDKAYESVRTTGGAAAAEAGLLYPVTWLSVVICPFIGAVALIQRKYWLFGLTVGCDLLLYMTEGMKHILFASPFLILLFLLIHNRERTFGLRLVWATGVVFSCFIAYVTITSTAYSGVALLIGANVILRVFAMPGMLLAAYGEFFSTHPHTLYSHVTGVNWLVTYPYTHPIGVELGIATAQTADYNMNAGFWATDGIAALGLLGIPIISVVVALVFYALDCVVARHNVGLVCICLSQYAIIMNNIPFFTSILTGGLYLFMIIFWIMPKWRENG